MFRVSRRDDTDLAQDVSPGFTVPVSPSPAGTAQIDFFEPIDKASTQILTIQIDLNLEPLQQFPDINMPREFFVTILVPSLRDSCGINAIYPGLTSWAKFVLSLWDRRMGGRSFYGTDKSVSFQKTIYETISML